MIDSDRLGGILEAAGLGLWRRPLDDLLAARLSSAAHGDFEAWRAAIEGLPEVERSAASLAENAVGAPQLELSAEDLAAVERALKALLPWRKGPFRVGPLIVDAEWQSDMKWRRIAAAASPLDGRLVLDVGCGNGYYGLRMRGAGARAVIGVDPTLLYVMQFLAVAHFIAPEPVFVLPLRLSELPPNARAFDTVFSMGVLYHQRAPVDHLRELRGALRPGGELVLETLILPDADARSRTPPDRYARMRNVWHLPSVAELSIWLARAGLVDVELADRTPTTVEEQRSTEWMPFDSLREALDPGDPGRTVEGWPAPLRAIVVCRAP